MWGWQGVLSLLAAAWLLQCVGTWIQIRRYRAAFKELSSGWPDGWMGAGKGGRFPRAGAIALLVVAPDETVRRVVAMTGRTVFARAERLRRFEGMSAAALREEVAGAPKDPVSAAVAAALDQISLVREGRAAAAAADRPKPDARAASGAVARQFATSPRH